MRSVSIRDLSHHFARYLKEVKAGESITVLEHGMPVADIVPHNKHTQNPGWKRPIKRRRIGGEALSATTIKCRESE